MRHLWLLWLAAAVAACLPPLSVPPLAALGLSAGLVACWVCFNVSAKQMFVTIMYGILDIFFREFVARNRFKVPPEGTPVIFVCAPHANQFLDPFVVMCGVGRSDVAFLAAAKSMRKRFVGTIARLLHSIPVERGHDLTAPGSGTVWLSAEDGTSLLGRGTRFTEELKPKDTVHWAGLTAQVGSIDSDEKCSLSDAALPPTGEWSPFRVTPHGQKVAASHRPRRWPLVGARLCLLRLPRARPTALGGSALPGAEAQPSGWPAVASCARARRLQGR